MSEQPLVSVIIIFLNGERFLKEAVGSVLAQTYKNWELLLVDDGSTDGSATVALNFAHQVPEKISYLTHPDQRNHGMSISRNLGIAHAKGEFIAFLDADDICLADKLNGQVAILLSQPEGFCVLNQRTGMMILDYEKTDVKFRKLIKDEIIDYVNGGSRMDKAGAYGIQDDFGAVFVERINGCYYNVVGLPLTKLYKALRKVT